mmetsp:Transcript_14679/g.40590  ORF Transcript_14679/g.40590 Transcript_14679/m.40590 type:complete len:1544 (+) Transcript_14679:117-4748(+)
MSNNSVSGGSGQPRGWLEGTLDVISGMGGPADGSSSGNNNNSNNNSGPSYGSAPNSPMRGVANIFNNSNSNNLNDSFEASQTGGFPEILRLPSQDSVDISIHNNSDSAHGPRKSSAQMIKELRQSNARLTARTAALEADFMNTLQKEQQQAAEREEKLQKICKEQQTQLKVAQAQVQKDKVKVQEQDEALRRFKEESAFTRHQISDLKSQLVEAQQQQSQLSPAAATAPDASSHHSNNSSSNAATAEVLQLKQTLQEMQEQHDDELNQLALQLKQEKQKNLASGGGTSGNNRADNDETADLSSQIDELRQKVLQYSTELTETQKELQQQQEQARQQDQWRQEEADDLRVLNDAQDEEIQDLRLQLQTAQAQARQDAEDLEASKQDIQELERQLKLQQPPDEIMGQERRGVDGEEANSNNVAEIMDLQRQLHVAQQDKTASVQKVQQSLNLIQQQWMEEKDDWVQERNALEQDMAVLQQQLVQLQQQGGNNDNDALVQSLQAEKKELEDQYQRLVADQETAEHRLMTEWKQRLEVAVAEKEDQVKKELKEAESDKNTNDAETLQTLEKENGRLKQQIRNLTLKSPRNIGKNNNTSGDMPTSPNALQQSPLSPARSVADQEQLQNLKIQLAEVTRDKQMELDELAEKLHDRDTTISALVKSSVSMEQQISSQQMQVDLLQAKLTQAQSEISNHEGMALGEGEEGVNVILASSTTTQADWNKLKSSLEAYKETETRLSNEVFRLKRQLHHAKLENNRLRQDLVRTRDAAGGINAVDAASVSPDKSNGSSNTNDAVVHAQQLHERDEAIARMVKQSMRQDETIVDLKQQLGVLQTQLKASSPSKSSKKSSSSSTLSAQDEIAQLRKETEMFAGQVIEQDEEIDSLNRQLTESSTQLADAERDAENYKRVAEASRKKAQLFEDKYNREAKNANKITTLEGEVTVLKQSLKDAQDKLDAAEAAPAVAPVSAPPPTVDMGRVHELEAEVDELREANTEQLSELRLLRRKVHDSNSAGDELDKTRYDLSEARTASDRLAKQVADLETELTQLKGQAAETSNDSMQEHRLMDLQHELVERDRIIGELKQNAMMIMNNRTALEPEEDIPADEGNGSTDDHHPTVTKTRSTARGETEVESLKDEIARLQSNLTSQSSALESARETIRELERMSAEQKEEEHARFEDEKDEMVAEVEELTRQLDEAQRKIDELRKDELIIDEFKGKLEAADEDRELSERTIVDNYERKLSLLTLDKDVIIDKIRKELSVEKETSAKDREEAELKLTEMEEEMNNLKEHAQAEIQERDSQIMALEQTLAASKQLIENMRTEMDHLQGSMVHATAGRREEIEDMQQELVEVTATATRQEREIGALRQEIHDKQVAHDSQVAKLQETIETLESQIGNSSPPENHRNAMDLAMELKVKEIKDRLDKLKWRNDGLGAENQLLRERLEKVGAGESVVQAEKQKIAQLQLKVAEQNKRIQGLEAKLERAKQEAAEANEAVEIARQEASKPPVLPPSVTESNSSGSKRGSNTRQGSRGFFGRRSKATDTSMAS